MIDDSRDGVIIHRRVKAKDLHPGVWLKNYGDRATDVSIDAQEVRVTLKKDGRAVVFDDPDHEVEISVSSTPSTVLVEDEVRMASKRERGDPSG